MHRRGFYPRMALVNLARNGQFYLPYLLTVMGTAAAYYIAVALAGAGDLPNMTRYSYLAAFMGIGTFVIAVFAAIFLTYTNSFLMKRRKKELGLYNILGMGKRHIALVLGFETLYTALFGVVGGVLLGLLLQKLVTLLLYKLMRFDAYFGFYFSWPAAAATLVLFGLILLGNLLLNLRRIHGQDPIELLRESSAGEREPKVRWPLTVLGVLCLGAGYGISLTARSAMAALALYFAAVFLVIIGTYCLFTSVSIAVLKALRANRRFYYRTRNFIGVSGMLYRMKRNAVGLANICILSTMVLVMVSGTLAMYLGSESSLEARFPADLRAEVRYEPDQPDAFDEAAFRGALEAALGDRGAAPEFRLSHRYASFYAREEDGVFLAAASGLSDCSSFAVMTAADYAALTGAAPPALARGQALVFQNGRASDRDVTFQFGDRLQTLRALAPSAKTPANGDFLASSAADMYYLVVADQEALLDLYRAQRDALGDGASPLYWRGSWNLGGGTDPAGLADRLLSDADFGGTGHWSYLAFRDRESYVQDYYSMNGGFFFLGLFLGALFLMAAVLIIYYKQLSEGYEDRERYLIMQKVGMEPRTVRQSVDMQMLVVFFAPLLAAAVHAAFDFGLMCRLLLLFSIRNANLTLLCTLGVLAAFAGVYALVYRATARAYYRLVKA